MKSQVTIFRLNRANVSKKKIVVAWVTKLSSLFKTESAILESRDGERLEEIGENFFIAYCYLVHFE